MTNVSMVASIIICESFSLCGIIDKQYHSVRLWECSVLPCFSLAKPQRRLHLMVADMGEWLIATVSVIGFRNA